MELRTDRYKLKELFPDRAKKYAQKYHIKADEIEYVRKGIPIDPSDISIEEGERAAIRLITTPRLDRDGEILLPDGAMLDDFRQSPSVLFAHKYDTLPVGKDVWIKPTKKGILAKTVYANHQFAEDDFQCVKGGFLNSNSVGFIPLDRVTQSDARFKDVVDRLEKEYGISNEEANGAKAIYTKWLLLEHSDVPVASNAQSLNIAVSKGELILDSPALRKELGIIDEPAVEPLIDKILDAENNPSMSDLFTAIGNVLNPHVQAITPVEPGAPPKPWYAIQDVFPVDFPNGHCIFTEYLLGRDVNPTYRQKYTYADGRATLKGTRVEIVVAYRNKEAEVITKPETTADYHRIPVSTGHEGHEIRTITVSAEDGIKGLYCIPCKEIFTYLFDVDKFTMAEAEAWVEDHKKEVARLMAPLSTDDLLGDIDMNFKEAPAPDLAGGMASIQAGIDAILARLPVTPEPVQAVAPLPAPPPIPAEQITIEAGPDITIEPSVPEKSIDEMLDAYIRSGDYKRAVNEAVMVALAKIRGRVI